MLFNRLSEDKMVAEEDIKIEDQSAFKDNRAPKCARCRNHGIVNSLKGHKHFCQWKNCTCQRCQVVVERQRITASRVASLRQQRKINASMRNGFSNNLKFHENVSPDNKYVNLDNVKYLSQMKKLTGRDSEYSLNDNDSERNSSGTPASLSPPASPNASSIASGDFDSKSRASSNYCTDPACNECWNNSPYLMSTNLDRLRTMFPMLTLRTLEGTLSRFRGNISRAIQHLLMSLRSSNAEYENNVRRSPCRDPNCKECDTVYTAPKRIEEYPTLIRNTNPATFMLSPRKRPLEYTPTSRYDEVPAKRLTPTKDFDYSRKSPVEEITRRSPVEEIRRRSPVEEITRRSPVEEITRRSSPVIELARRSPIEDNRQSPIEEFIRRRSPVELYSSSADESEFIPPKMKSRILLPPTLLRPCVDCKSSISVDDKFCGQCGFKQTLTA